MPKLMPLSKRHRRGRQSNLCNMLSSTTSSSVASSSSLACTTRIVSEEDMQQTSSSESSSMIFDKYDSNKVVDDRCSTKLPCNEHQLLPDEGHQFRTNLNLAEGRLKRPAPSLCLVNLANTNSNCERAEEPYLTTPCRRQRSCSIDSSCDFVSPCSRASPWGQFVDMLITEDEESDPVNVRQQPRRSFLPCPSQQVCGSDPYPRRTTALRPRSSKRVPLTFSSRFRATTSNTYPQQREQPLEGFILTCPDMDEAAERLGSLSF